MSAMIGIVGNAPVDLIARVDGTFLARYGLIHGRCTPISAETQRALLAAARWQAIPGGCGANIAASLALLGNAVAFTAPFGDDAHGAMARDSLSDLGVVLIGDVQPVESQIVFTLIDPDGDRSFAAYYDVERDIAEEDLCALPCDGALLIDGYALLYPRHRDAIMRYVAARPPDASPLIFCPNDESVILEQRPAVDALIGRASHLLLSQREAALLWPGSGPCRAADRLVALGKAGAITLGAEGALLFAGSDREVASSALGSAPLVDSNGAGDAFAAGYVHALVADRPIARAADLAARCAAVLLQTVGARPPADFAMRVNSL